MIKKFVNEVRFEIRKRFIGFDVPEIPHMDVEALEVFQASLKSCNSYLEFGAGGSTLLAARLGKDCVSIEGDRYYYRDVAKRLSRIANCVELHYVDIGPTERWGRPRNSGKNGAAPEKWARYAGHPFEALGPQFYDLILIDGRFRVACAIRSIMEGCKRQAQFKILFDDYRMREFYHQIELFVGPPILSGQMAIFNVNDRSVLRVPTELDFASALRDPR